MAEKQTKARPKAKAKPEPKAEPVDKPVLSVELERAIEAPAVPELVYSASDLAAMARKSKANKNEFLDVVIDLHEDYLSAVKQGAIAPAADVDFVKKHLAHLKTL